VKHTVLALTAAAAFGLLSFAAPASAKPQSPLAGVSTSDLEVSSARYGRRKVCTVRKVVTRHHGHRHVRTVRVCR
jgi:hypothetical protein